MTSTNKRDSRSEKNDVRRDAGGEVARYSQEYDTGCLVDDKDGDWVKYADVERALAESRECTDRWKDAAMVQGQAARIAEARAERLAEASREVISHVSPRCDGTGPDSGWITDRLSAALEQELQE